MARIHRIVSMPDTFNADLADLAAAPSAIGYPSPKGNSWSESRAAHVKAVMDLVAAEGADSVLVPGGMVGGQWHDDSTNSGHFGTAEDFAKRTRRLERAADAYYEAWKSWWADSGMSVTRVHPAIGASEVGDSPWSLGGGKYDLMPTFKAKWAEHFTYGVYPYRPNDGAYDGTAYTRWLVPDRVLLVTLDPFQRSATGVALTVAYEQQQWLRETLRYVDTSRVLIIAQCSLPVLGPNRVAGSSGLMVDGGGISTLWETLTALDVDMYLCGEMHATTAIQRGPAEPVQITHGGRMALGQFSWLVLDVDEDGTVDVTAKAASSVRVGNKWLWQSNRPQYAPAALTLSPTVDVIGTLRLMPDGVVEERTGLMEPYLTPAW